MARSISADNPVFFQNHNTTVRIFEDDEEGEELPILVNHRD
jgi:hypothetical protein